MYDLLFAQAATRPVYVGQCVVARTSSTRDALRVTFQVMASVLSLTPPVRRRGTRPGCTPTYAHRPRDVAAAERRRLGAITRSPMLVATP